MNTSSKQFLFNLLNTPSPTGFELPGMRVWAKEVKKHADTVENDAYGNTWATLKGKGTNVLMLEAHADEIGYIVKYISKEGYISIDILGGSDTRTARGRRVTIFGDKGEITGIIANIAIHIRDYKEEKAPKAHELFVDIGAKDDKEVAKMGIRVGHPIVYCDQAIDLGPHGISSRALDNRLGGFVVAEVMKNLAQKKSKLNWTVIAANSVQEEIGGYGARMLSYRLSPNACICVDGTHATDTPDVKHQEHGKVELNKGPSVTHGGCNHPSIVKSLTDVAKKKKIDIQHESSSRYSGSDTDSIYHSKEGIPCALLSVPMRYMHSVVELVDYRDIDRTINLLTGFVESLSAKQEFGVKVLSRV
jgi:endoglucanase